MGKDSNTQPLATRTTNMQRGRFHVVTDGQWGSCGKGLITTALAAAYKPAILSTTSMANAGHTAVWSDGRKFIAKALPSAAALNAWQPNYNPSVLIGATAAFNLEQLLKEKDECRLEDEQLFIHPRAGVITREHAERETSLENGTKHVASTMQGCGTFLADKVMRRKELRLAEQYDELQQYIQASFHSKINVALDGGQTILHEGSQGFSLDINHGSHYPQCTSRGTSAVQNLADMGVRPQRLGEVYVVIRPYPIRVGNVVENGSMVGYSGDAYPGQNELTWAEVAKRAGAPPEVTAGELTTVTKRLRRVFEFSDRQLREACMVNGCTQIALNFANYLDWRCYGKCLWSEVIAFPAIREFIERCEGVTGCPVTILGTGPQNNHVAFRDYPT